MSELTTTTSNNAVFGNYKPKNFQYFLRFVGFKKKFHVLNHTDYDAKIVVSPGEIFNVECIKIGPAEFNMAYECASENVQESNLLANAKRKIYTCSRDSYVTVLMRVADEWIVLFKNRRHSISKDLNIYNRHIREAKLNM